MYKTRALSGRCPIKMALSRFAFLRTFEVNLSFKVNYHTPSARASRAFLTSRDV